jgi:hypothetical protein
MSYSYKVNKNQIKYTLQKGKILDMPLQEPYTEAGNNLDSGTLTIGKIYIITAHDTKDFTADGAPNNNIGTIFTATSSTVTLDVDNMVKELNSVAKDKTPNNNNGTINGTIITYNGLVNNTAGVAYITLKRQNTYQFRVKYQNTGITLMFAAQNIYGSTGYGIRLNTDGKLQLYKDNNSIAETAIDYLINNTNYQFKIT